MAGVLSAVGVDVLIPMARTSRDLGTIVNTCALLDMCDPSGRQVRNDVLSSRLGIACLGCQHGKTFPYGVPSLLPSSAGLRTAIRRAAAPARRDAKLSDSVVSNADKAAGARPGEHGWGTGPASHCSRFYGYCRHLPDFCLFHGVQLSRQDRHIGCIYPDYRTGLPCLVNLEHVNFNVGVVTFGDPACKRQYQRQDDAEAECKRVCVASRRRVDFLFGYSITNENARNGSKAI
jgi:hypothetical protein